MQRYSSFDHDPQSTSVSLKNRTVRDIDIKLVRPESTYLEDVSIIYTLNEDLEEDGNLLVKEYLEKIEEVSVPFNVWINSNDHFGDSFFRLNGNFSLIGPIRRFTAKLIALVVSAKG